MQHNNTLATTYAINGLGAYNKGHYAEAIAFCEIALKLDAKNINSYWCRAISYFKQGKYKQTIDDIDVIIGLNPHIIKTLGVSISNFFARTKIPAPRAESINWATLLNQKAQTHLKAGKNEEAKIQFTIALSFYPNAESYVGRARAQNKQQIHNKAIADCKAALKLDPTNQQAYEEMAHAYAKMGAQHANYGRSGQAIYNYVKTLKINSKDAEIANKIKLILEKKSKQEIFALIQDLPKNEAIKLLKQALDRNTLLGKKFREIQFAFFRWSTKIHIVDEAREYLKILTTEEKQIKTTARLIAQGQRDPQSAFFKLPPEIGFQIAATVNNTLEPKKVNKLVENNFGIPRVAAKRR